MGSKIPISSEAGVAHVEPWERGPERFQSRKFTGRALGQSSEVNKRASPQGSQRQGQVRANSGFAFVSDFSSDSILSSAQ